MDTQTSSNNWIFSYPGKQAWYGDHQSAYGTCFLLHMSLTPNVINVNRERRLGCSKHSPVVISCHISAPSSFNNATLSHFLKSSIVFLLYTPPWHLNLHACPSNCLPQCHGINTQRMTNLFIIYRFAYHNHMLTPQRSQTQLRQNTLILHTQSNQWKLFFFPKNSLTD